MHTGFVLFTVIALPWAFTSASFPYILSVSRKESPAVSSETSSWLRSSIIDSLWGVDDRAKTNLDDYDTPSESEERLLKKHWDFIKKLKGKEESTTKKPKKKGHKHHNDEETASTSSPLLSIGFLSGLFGEDPVTQSELDVANATDTPTTTADPSMLIIDANDSLPASEETVEIKTAPKPPAVNKTKIARPNKKAKPTKPTKENNEEESEQEDEEAEADDDSEEDEEEVEDDDDEENFDNGETEIILDHHPKGPDGSDVMEPADIKMLGKKADLYLRLNKAHKSAKDFLGVFKGVYVDYVKNRPHVGLEFGTRGRSVSPNVYDSSVNRMGETWNYYRRRSQLDYPEQQHQAPQMYFSSYSDYDEYHLPQQYFSRNIFPRYVPIREEKQYIFTHPYARLHSRDLHFHFPDYYDYEVKDSYEYMY